MGILNAIKSGLKSATPLVKDIPMAEDQSLGALVAFRMQGQLEKAAETLKVDPTQFTRAYAGDKRSVKPALKQLQEQENLSQGLPASPGRRKVLKQAASAALQSQVPGSLVSKVLSTPLDEGIARASMEANLPQIIDPDLMSQKLFDFMTRGNIGDEIYDMGVEKTFPTLIQHSMKHFYPQDKLPYLNSAMDKLMKNNGDDFADAGDLLYANELSKALKGKRPSYIDPEDWDEVKANFKNHPLNPEELEAIRYFEKKTLPSPVEGMDEAWESMGDPPTTSMRDFNKWIQGHESSISGTLYDVSPESLELMKSHQLDPSIWRQPNGLFDLPPDVIELLQRAR